MNNLLRLLRVGDRGCFEGEPSEIRGSRARTYPDNRVRREWLLVAVGDRPAEAMEEKRARWLSWDDSLGAILWSPFQWPAELRPLDAAELSGITLGGCHYVREQSGWSGVTRIDGAVIGDSAHVEAVEYVELVADRGRLSLQWNEFEHNAYSGTAVALTDLRESFRGVPFDLRALGPASLTAAERAAETAGKWEDWWYNRQGASFIWRAAFMCCVLLFCLSLRD